MKKINLSKALLLVLAVVAVVVMITNGKKWFLEGVNDAKENRSRVEQHQ